jgi:hypothetical protein
MKYAIKTAQQKREETSPLSLQDFAEDKLRARFSQLQLVLKTTQDPSKRYLTMNEMMAFNVDLVKIRLLKLSAELKSGDCSD